MIEQFVSSEIALKLKEKGFNECCLGYYNTDPQLTRMPFTIGEPFKHVWVLSAPLWQQVINWLREKHEIEIVISGITVFNIRKYHVCLYYKVDGIMTDHSILIINEISGNMGYQTFTYQEALQKAIEEALLLI